MTISIERKSTSNISNLICNNCINRNYDKGAFICTSGLFDFKSNFIVTKCDSYCEIEPGVYEVLKVEKL